MLSFCTSEILLIFCLSFLWPFKRNSRKSSHLICFPKKLGNVCEEADHLMNKNCKSTGLNYYSIN